jgi:hypothetical protein
MFVPSAPPNDQPDLNLTNCFLLGRAGDLRGVSLPTLISWAFQYRAVGASV